MASEGPSVKVSQALLSVRELTRRNNRVVFDEEGSYIEDKMTGEKMWLKEVNGMYMLKMWVPREQASPF